MVMAEKNSPNPDIAKEAKIQEKHQGVLAQRGYRQVSLPSAMIRKIEKYLEKNKDEGFTSVPDFIRSAIRNKLDKSTPPEG